MPKHLFKPRATLYSPPTSLTSNCRVVQIRLSPGSNRSITSPKLSKSQRQFSFGLMFIARGCPIPEVFDSQESGRILEANVFDQTRHHRLVMGKQSRFNIVSQNIAQDSPKIFVAGKGHERPRVSDHSNK